MLYIVRIPWYEVSQNKYVVRKKSVAEPMPLSFLQS